MTNRFFSPDQQFADTTGAPYAGGFLHFYASGTSTPLDTYSDSALTVANTNPVVLDSAGRAGSVFLQNLAYKVVLQDSTGAQVWTQDPVWSSDYSTYASFQAYGGNPNGLVAGTAATTGTLPGSSVLWDYVNNVLYVCTTTGTATTAVWTAVNTSNTTPHIPVPTGYLTLVSGTPIITTDQIGATAVIYTPYQGNIVPIYNGTTFTVQTFAELTLTLVASHAANTLYDVFIFNNSGVLTLVTGPAWSNSTAGSCTRGTGAGTTQITRTQGLWTNSVSMTGRNGNTTYSIGANLATYLGTIFIDATAGQVTCHRSWGQNRKFGVWNAYNRVPIYLSAGDSTVTWNYTTSTNRASNNSPSAWSSNAFNVGSGTACNGMVVLDGLAEEIVHVGFSQLVTTSTGSPFIGLGLNSTTTITGTLGTSGPQGSGANKVSVRATVTNAPALGITTMVSIENGQGGTGVIFNGTQGNMVLNAMWEG